MNMWTHRVLSSLAPLSINTESWSSIINEWYYNNNMIDIGKPIETCQLCGHRGIKYQFEIQNKYNSNTLLVGSECISRFELTGFDDEGSELSSDETRKKVAKDRRLLINEGLKRKIINYLISLRKVDVDINIDRSIDMYGERGGFSPKHTAFLMWRLKKYNISHNPKDFKVCIRKNEEKKQMKNLKDWQIRIIWPALTKVQIEKYSNYLHF